MMKQTTVKRSLTGRIYISFLRFLHINKKLAKASFTKLQQFEDKKTPITKKYGKEVIGNAVCWWIQKEKISNGIYIYLPGGGFIIGPSKLHWKYCESMAKLLNMSVLVIRYPLAPENPFPAGLNAIVQVITNLQMRSVLKENWYVGGDSAGGNLALSLCYQLFQQQLSLPKKIVLSFPSVDMGEDENDPELISLSNKDIILSKEFTLKVKEVYAGQNDITNPLLSPVNGDLSVLPPVLLQHGTNDILVKGSRLFVKKMQHAGNPIQYEEYEGMYHGFSLAVRFPKLKKLLDHRSIL